MHTVNALYRRLLCVSLFTAIISFSKALSSLKMSGSLIDAANFAIKQSPSSTRFITNKMCPFAQKAWIALEVSRAPYDMEEVSLYGPGGKPDWFWKLNPDGTVPILVCHGGAVVLPDSDVILDQIAGGSALGAGLDVLQLKKDDDTSEKIRSWRSMIREMLPVGKKAVQGGGTGLLFQKLKPMDANVIGPFLCGDKVTIADCAAFPFIWRINDEFGLDGCENLKTWLDARLEEEAFAKTVQSSWWWWW